VTSTRDSHSREPQQDRSRATRQRLLDTAVECLAELGFAATTLTVVAERAGVSRGAAQHHFRTHEELITVALTHIIEAQVADLRAVATTLPPTPRSTEAVLGLLTNLYTGVLFRASLHLWVAASADDKLHAVIVPLERRVGRVAHDVAVELLGVDENVPGVRETVQATLDLARGLGLAALLTDDSARRGRVLHRWAQTLDAILPTTSSAEGAAARGESPAGTNAGGEVLGAARTADRHD
jgi:AcrR family transcriptional regulator